ncbi:MAG: c-type cytochrome [Verrucomicrobia bacterium]|nr:MAG: c-type cytochrome [Verrucomicrobiota bacterium]
MKRPSFPSIAATVFLALSFPGPARPAPPDTTGFQLDPRLEIHLWAAEPDVVDPVSLCFDEQGNAYVAECRDYPLGAGPGGKVGSTVRLLRDTDGDGRADRSTVFAANLGYATAVTPWRGGILVAAAPDILFLRDNDGDGVADTREVLVTGFVRGVSDSLVNGLCFGPDNRIHGANGGNGGTLRSPRLPGNALALGEDDFAFDPDTGRVEATGRSGGGFGLVFDDWGRVFTTYNINHLQHRFLDKADYAVAPGFPAVETTGTISDHEEMSRIFPVSEARTRPNHPEQSGRFSAAGGMGRLGAAAWPADLRGSIFVCDVVGNLVHRDVIQPSGATFVATRAPSERDREFLASRDPVCRPVGLVDGPDGALYLLDMQRDVIEHPDYIPARVREKLDVRAGQDRGRIYRIVPKATPVPTRVTANTADAAELVPLLGHGDQWWRVTAQRLLVERHSPAPIAAIRSLARTHADPRGRVHALWTLQGLGALDAGDLAAALDDAVPEARECALVLVKRTGIAGPAIASRVWKLCHDPWPRVRFAALLATPRVPAGDPSASRSTFSRALARDPADPWMRRAVLSAIPVPDRIPVLKARLAEAGVAPAAVPSDTAHEGIRELADLVGATPELAPVCLAELLPDIARPTTPAPLREAVLAGLQSGLARSDGKPALDETSRRGLDGLAARATPRELRLLWRLARLAGVPDSPARLQALDRARRTATDPTRPAAERIDALGLLEFGGSPADTTALLGCLGGTEPTAVQSAAFDVLRGQKDAATGVALVERWRALAPGIRPRALQLLLDRRTFHEPLVASLERKKITVGELSLDLEQRRRLLRSGVPGIAARAARHFGDEEYSNRKAVVADWLARIPAAGKADHGRALFAELCAKCHRCGDVGERVGPDLGGVAHRSVEDLLGNILDPNMAINPGFVSYQAETRDGDTVVGLLAAESAESITLVQAGGVKQALSRRNLVRLESTGSSLMPEGLEAGRTPQDLRDLVAFLQESR